MANEHVLMTQKSFPISMTVADGTAIEKGSVLKMTSRNTAIITSGANDTVAGIAYTEKIASDGNTQIAVLVGPGDELRAIASGSITVGDPLATATGGFPNYLYSLLGTDSSKISGSIVIGYAKETVTVGQTFKYVLDISNI